MHMYVCVYMCARIKEREKTSACAFVCVRVSLYSSTQCPAQLNNHKTNKDPSVLTYPQTDTEDDHLVFGKEEEATVKSFKKGKSARLDNILATPVHAEREPVTAVLTTIFINI